jgi:glycosyltransferase involved in cell wall biosynthesis
MPILNEEESLKSIIDETVQILEQMDTTWELVAVDDGSTDRSMEILRDLNAKESRLKVVSFRANFGQTAAMAAGIKFARGLVIVTMDADGQNDPSEIPRLVSLIAEGADFVAGWRKCRQDPLSRRLPSRAANWLIGKATGVVLHDYGCSLKAFRSEIAKDVMLIGEMHRMIPILVKREGGSIQELVVNHRPRTAGFSKYGLSRTPRVVADLLVARFLLASVSKPMYFFGKFSILGLLVGVISGALALYMKLADLRDFVETPLPLLGIFSLMFASLTFLLGLIAEIIVRIHFQQTGPPYKVRSVLGL